jgi:hypothetical protein
MAQGSGTITALNGTVIANIIGDSTAVFNVSGMWTAIINIQATVDGINWFNIEGFIPALPLVATSLTTNQSIVVGCAGYQELQLIATSFTSGTINVAWASSQSASSQLVNQGYPQPSSSVVTSSIAFDAVASNTQLISSSPSTATWTHTCSGTNRLLIVSSGYDANQLEHLTSVTYNGISLTKIITVGLSPSNDYGLELWYLVNPPAGSFTVSITWNTFTLFSSAASLSFTGVNQTTPIGNFNSTASNNSLTETTSVNNAWIVDMVFADASTSPRMPNSGQTLQWSFLNNTRGTWFAGSTSGPFTPAGNYTTGYSSGTLTAMVSAVINPSIAIVSNAWPIEIVDSGGVNITNVLPSGSLKAAGISNTSTLTNVASSASSVQLLASNANRLMAVIFNDSTATLYMNYGATASTSAYTVQIPANGYFEFPSPVYTGTVNGIWTSANGNARITELT